MSGSVIQEKLSFKMLRLISSSKLDWCSYIISIAKVSSKKNGALILSMKCFSLQVAQLHENVHVPQKNAETNPRINFVHLDIF